MQKNSPQGTTRKTIRNRKKTGGKPINSKYAEGNNATSASK